MNAFSGHMLKKHMTVIGQMGRYRNKVYLAAHIAWAVFYIPPGGVHKRSEEGPAR